MKYFLFIVPLLFLIIFPPSIYRGIAVIFICLMISAPPEQAWTDMLRGFDNFGFDRINWKIVGIASIVLLLLVAVVQLFTMLIFDFFDIPLRQQNVHEYLISLHGISLYLGWFTVVILAPVTEEIVFRHFLFGGIARLVNWRLAAILCAFIFAAIHFDWQQIPGLFLLALAWQFVYLKTGNLGNSIMLHMINNFFALVFSLL